MVIRKPRESPPPNPGVFRNHAAAAAFAAAYPNYVAMAMRQSQPFTPGEIRRFLTVLSQAAVVLSLFFIFQGMTCIGFATEKEYGNFCGSASLAGLCGLAGGLLSLATLRWPKRKFLTVVHLMLSITSAVATLILVVATSIWSLELSKKPESSTSSLAIFWICLLLAVTQGVCFILSSVFICLSWEHRRNVYTLENLTQAFEPMLSRTVTHTQSRTQSAFVEMPA